MTKVIVSLMCAANVLSCIGTAEGQTVEVAPPSSTIDAAKFEAAIREFRKQCPECALGVQTQGNTIWERYALQIDSGHGKYWWVPSTKCAVPAWLDAEKDVLALDAVINRLLSAEEQAQFRANDPGPVCASSRFVYRLDVLKQKLGVKK